MAAAAAPVITGAEDVVLMQDISWNTYCRLNDENELLATRMAFFEGTLEIMTVSAKHEKWERKIDFLVRTLADSLGLDCEGFASVTMRRSDLLAGVEPDACFYFGPLAAAMRGREELDLHIDPAPELAVEVDISRRSISKFSLYASLGVAELWRFHQDEVLIYRLEGRQYQQAAASQFLPNVSAVTLSHLLADANVLPLSEWIQRIRSAAHQR